MDPILDVCSGTFESTHHFEAACGSGFNIADILNQYNSEVLGQVHTCSRDFF